MHYTLESVCGNNNFEEVFKEFIEKKFEEDNLVESFPNPLIKEDVINILDRFCTVIYYPLYDDGNNGFHINDMPCGGKTETFVYINTAQTMEKQVFTAAHELGHIWKVEQEINDKMKLDSAFKPDSQFDSLEERIVNRFAAVLLMPERNFIMQFQSEKGKYTKSNHIKFDDMCKLVVFLMEYFFAPFKSVVIRMIELSLISENIGQILLEGNEELPKEKVDERISELLAIYGYKKFLESSNKKWIHNLPELLNKAEENGSVSKSVIENMRNKFDLKRPDIPEQFNTIMNIS